MKAAILGTTGYTGMVLLRMLADHPDVTDVLPGSSSQAGDTLDSIDPGIGDALRAKTESCGGRLLSVEEIERRKPDVLFSCLPHLASAAVCAPFFGTSVVVDLSADFRIRDPELFRKAYKENPPRPDLPAVYGLSEIYRDEIRRADLIANPGCYPTASLLPLLPFARAGLLRGKIIVDALSGVSGAGKKVNPNYLFVARDENSGAYNPGTTHRHHAEIAERISEADASLRLLFTPHLVPLSRGMAATITVETKRALDDEAIEGVFGDAYSSEPFVRILRGRIPSTKDVLASNRCDIGWHIEDDTLMLFSVIDNLAKGASGQAVQNMNIRFGLRETAGLRTYGEL